jgi:hypothetical protein
VLPSAGRRAEGEQLASHLPLTPPGPSLGLTDTLSGSPFRPSAALAGFHTRHQRGGRAGADPVPHHRSRRPFCPGTSCPGRGLPDYQLTRFLLLLRSLQSMQPPMPRPEEAASCSCVTPLYARGGPYVGRGAVRPPAGAALPPESGGCGGCTGTGGELHCHTPGARSVVAGRRLNIKTITPVRPAPTSCAHPSGHNTGRGGSW